MFASQLLRILQTIPSDVKHETCVFDPAEQDTTMKEKQYSALYDSKSFRREGYPLAVENEEIYQLKGSTIDASPVAFNVKSWNPFEDDFSTDIANGAEDFPIKENRNEFPYPLTIVEDADTISSDMNNMEKIRGHESSLEVDELSHHNSSESRDSCLPCVATSDFCGKEKNAHTDKDVLNELPELSVCYKEINYHIVKDICVDEGLPVKDKISIGSYKHEESNSFILKPHENNKSEATEGGVDVESFISDEIATISMENNIHGAEDRCGVKQDQCGDLFAQGKPKSQQPQSCLDEDTAKHTASENSEIKASDAKKCGQTGVTETDALQEESFVDKKLPIQEFGTRSFLRSFMSSLDFEENIVEQLPDQIASGNGVSEVAFVSSTKADSKEDMQATSLLYNSQVENGSITFNFDSLAPVVAERRQNINQHSVDSGNLHDHKCESTDNSLPDPSQVESTSNRDNNSGENPHEQCMKSKNENFFDEPLAASPVQSINNNELNQETIHEESSLVKKDQNSDDLLVGGRNSHEHQNYDNVSAVAPLQHDEGETSFSAAGAGLITYSGPIAYSGSLSIRSDGSTTSTRSFAFPVLQTEWNSSPVRMAKADRKHKGWRSGLLCCRF